MVGSVPEEFRQRAFLNEVFRVLYRELKVSGFMNKVDAKIPGTVWTGSDWRDATPKVFLKFHFLDGSFAWLSFEFKNPRLPILYLAPGGGVRYEIKRGGGAKHESLPWDTGVLPGEVYATLCATLLEECRSLLRRHNITPSQEARRLFDM